MAFFSSFNPQGIKRHSDWSNTLDARDYDAKMRRTADSVKKMPKPLWSIPKPIFSVNVAASPSTIPPTPVRKQRTDLLKSQATSNKFITARSLFFDNPDYPLPPKEGNYKKVFIHHSKQSVIKVYRQEMDGKHWQEYSEWTQHAMDQYKILKDLEINCAVILNDPIIEGYFKQEFVDLLNTHPLYELMTRSAAGPEYSDVELEKLKPLLSEITNFFLIGLIHHLDLDLLVDNIGIKNEHLCIMDYKEEPENDDIEDVACYLSSCLKKSWGKKMPKFYPLLLKEIRMEIDSQILDPLIKKDLLNNYFTMRPAYNE